MTRTHEDGGTGLLPSHQLRDAQEGDALSTTECPRCGGLGGGCGACENSGRVTVLVAPCDLRVWRLATIAARRELVRTGAVHYLRLPLRVAR